MMNLNCGKAEKGVYQKMTFKLPNTVPRTIFRTNDIRGNVQNELTPDVVYAIGLAFGSEVLKSQQQNIVIARDGRLSSPTLAQALTQGLMESGCDVIDIDSVPTPLLYFATHVLETSSGIMITGSHNPPEDNGLKIDNVKFYLKSKFFRFMSDFRKSIFCMEMDNCKL